MKKIIGIDFLILIVGITFVTACTDSSSTSNVVEKPESNQIRVYDFNTDAFRYISESDINGNDLRCIARISVLRDILIDSLRLTYKNNFLTDVTEKQDNYFNKYSFTVPTKLIDREKRNFIKAIPNDESRDGFLYYAFSQCNVNIATYL